MLTDVEKMALRELCACRGVIDADQYAASETLVLERLQVLGLVKVAWVITDQGRHLAATLAETSRNHGGG